MIERFVAAAEAGSASATEAALDEMLASGSFESVVDDLLLPAAAALGDAWASRPAERRRRARRERGGRAAARPRRSRRRAAGPGVGGRRAPAGSRHELGALAFAAALRRRGVGVLYLGSDVTVDGWLDAVGPDAGAGGGRRRGHRCRPGRRRRSSSTALLEHATCRWSPSAGRRPPATGRIEGRAPCGCPIASSMPPRPWPRRSFGDADRPSARSRGRAPGDLGVWRRVRGTAEPGRRGPTGAGGRAAESRVERNAVERPRRGGRGTAARRSRSASGCVASHDDRVDALRRSTGAAGA